MGLDAVVYRRKEHLQLGADEEWAKLDRTTGEIYFDDPVLSRKYYRRREAVAHRLGNVTAIAILREETLHLIGPESFLERRVLYSGTHCGDAIAVADLDQLSADLQRVRESGRASALMQELVGALEELIAAARNEENPIVF